MTRWKRDIKNLDSQDHMIVDPICLGLGFETVVGCILQKCGNNRDRDNGTGMQ